MAGEQKAGEIQARFEAEQDYIARYASFLQIKSNFHDRQISELNTILEQHGLLVMPTRRFDRIGKPFNELEISAVGGVSEMVAAEIKAKIGELGGRLERLPKPDASEVSRDNEGLFSEWVEYLLQNYMPDTIEKGGSELREGIFAQAQDQAPDSDAPWEETQQIITDALEAAKEVSLKIRIDGLRYVLEQVQFLHVHARVVQPDAEINLLRQAFLLLMTAFDAAVFDLVRVALHNRFFQLIGAFARQDNKLSLEQLGSYGGWDRAQGQIIEDELKQLYLKDLLYKLSGEWKVECVDRQAGDKFIQLIELVQRRNLHVHSRGVVDEKYLDRDQHSQKPKYNLFNLSLGDPAVIDEEYWETATKLCRVCVQRVAAWAGA